MIASVAIVVGSQYSSHLYEGAAQVKVLNPRPGDGLVTTVIYISIGWPVIRLSQPDVQGRSCGVDID